MNELDFKDIKVDLDQLKRDREANFKDRLAFIDLWVEYIKKHSDKEWTEQQNVVIDSQMDSRS